MPITRKEFINLMEQSELEEAEIYKDSKHLRVLTYRDDSGFNVGNDIAYFNSKQAIINFFKFASTLEVSVLTPLLLNFTKNNWHIGQHIASQQDTETIKLFIDFVKKNCPDILPTLLTSKTKRGWHIGNFIARNPDTVALIFYFELVNETIPKLLPNLLTAVHYDYWTLAHQIARYHDSEAIKLFFDFVNRHTPDLLPKLLTSKTSNEWTLGHLIAHNHELQTISDYLDIVLQQKKRLQAIILFTENEDGDTFFSLILKNNSAWIGEVIFKCITHRVPMTSPQYLEFQNYKKEVLDYIGTLSAKKQVIALQACKSRSTPLGRYFAVKASSHLRLWRKNPLLVTIDKQLKRAIAIQSDSPHTTAIHVKPKYEVTETSESSECNATIMSVGAFTGL